MELKNKKCIKCGEEMQNVSRAKTVCFNCKVKRKQLYSYNRYKKNGKK